MTDITDIMEIVGFENEGYSARDWDNLIVVHCDNCGESIPKNIHEQEEECRHCGYLDNVNLESTLQEIYLYYIVTRDLGIRLKEMGEPILIKSNHVIWGRDTIGQAVELDGVMDRIATDLGLVEERVRKIRGFE